jgi:predicted Fe-Mo cluster-binding NifX family protein
MGETIQRAPCGAAAAAGRKAPAEGADERPRPRRKVFRPDRVAVATLTGEDIDACFGRTESFQIYDLVQDEGGFSYSLSGSRPGPRPCRGREHDQALLEETAELLKDCGMVLAGRIGPGAAKALSDRGVMGLSAPLSVKDALRRLAAG